MICDNQLSGIGYAQRDATRTLPNPRPPAFVRPIDIFSFAPPSYVDVHGNSDDGKAYKPHSARRSLGQVRHAPRTDVTVARS